MNEPILRPSKHPRYNWEVTAPQSITGTRIRRQFVAKPEAMAFLADVKLRAKRGTRTTLSEERFLDRWRSLLTVPTMEEACRRMHAGLSARDARTVGPVLTSYAEKIDTDHTRGVVSQAHRDTEVSAAHRLGIRLSGVKVSGLTTVFLQAWFDEHAHWSPRTKRNHLATLRAALTHSHITPDPTKGVRFAKVATPVSIVSPDDLEHLLTVAATRNDATTYWWLVFGAFAGLRTSEIERLSWGDLALSDETPEVYVLPGKTKAACRWVKVTAPMAYALTSAGELPASAALVFGTSTRRQRQAARRATFAAAGLTVPANALRHSFGSHHLVEHSDPQATAMQMGHSSPRITFASYRRAVSTTQASAYWSLKPQPVTPPTE